MLPLSPEMKSRIIRDFIDYQDEIEGNRNRVFPDLPLRERMRLQDRMVESIRAGDLLGLINAYEAGAEIHVPDRTHGDLPLNIATAMDDAAPFLLMLHFAGVDVNARGKNGDTPLHVASRNADGFCVRKLLLNRADSLVKNDAGEVPLAVLDSEKDARLNAGSCRKILAGGLEIHLRNQKIRTLDVEGSRGLLDFRKGAAPAFLMH